MTPIFDRTGQVVAWLKHAHIYDLEGRHVGFVHGEHVFSNLGRHIGSQAGGFFRDHVGGAVAFQHDAMGGPVLPPLAYPPAPPIPVYPRLPVIHSWLRRPAQPSLTWSVIDWGEFIAGHGPSAPSRGRGREEVPGGSA
jgi:hypothetical protein